MEFKNTKGIFQQIADAVCEKIVHDEYKPNEKLPSVRELAASLGVNPNTVMRTYTELQNDNIIRNRRGIGFFVEEKAMDKILSLRKREFFQQELPEFIKKVELLSLSAEDIAPIIQNLQKLVKDEN